jgi:uncharacterized protein
MAHPVLTNLASALTRAPRPADWASLAIELGWLAPALALLGFAGGFIRWVPMTDVAGAARLAALLFFIPALGEEIVFRGLLVAPRSAPFPLWRLALSLAAFVLWHPLQLTFWRPPWAPYATNPCFVAAITLLGVALIRLYRATGSLWPPVLLHWAVVAAWKLLCGDA